MRLRFDDDKLGGLGSVLCGVYAFLMLIIFAINVFVFKNTDFYSMVNSAINVVFYIFICSYFMKGKNNPYYIYVAILSLIISDYVLPLIFGFIIDFSSMIATLSFNLFIIPISLICGLLYFIFMYLEKRNYHKSYVITMEVCSIILFVLGLISLGVGIYGAIISISAILRSSGTLSLLDSVFYISSDVFSLLATLVAAGFPLIYFVYSLTLKRND